MEKVLSVNKKVEQKNYPWGNGNVRTSAFYWIEFNSKGFRHFSQILNPKTGVLSKPKALDYKILCYFREEKGGYIDDSYLTPSDLHYNNHLIRFVAENKNKLELTNDMLAFFCSRIAASNELNFFRMGGERVMKIRDKIINPHLEKFRSMIKNKDYSKLKSCVVDIDKMYQILDY